MDCGKYFYFTGLIRSIVVNQCLQLLSSTVSTSAFFEVSSVIVFPSISISTLTAANVLTDGVSARKGSRK